MDSYRPAVQIAHRQPCHPCGMDFSKMTRQEIEALLKLLAEWEREEMELLLQERLETERDGRLHCKHGPEEVDS